MSRRDIDNTDPPAATTFNPSLATTNSQYSFRERCILAQYLELQTFNHLSCSILNTTYFDISKEVLYKKE